MKKLIKYLTAAVLTLAMVAAVVPAVSAQAETRNLTMYVGESISYSIFSGDGITSVKSSNKKIVSVSKDKNSKYKAILNANKASNKKTKITVGYKDYHGKTQTNTINVTVKKANVTAKLTPLSDGYVLLTLTNKGKQTFDAIRTAYQLCDASGNVVKQDYIDTYDVPAGKTVYDKISYDNYAYSVDTTKCQAVVAAVSHNPDHKYIDPKAKFVVSDSIDNSGSYPEVKLQINNKYTEYVKGTVFVMIYDANNNLIDLREHSVYAKPKTKDTDKITIYSNNYDHYTIKTAVYSEKY